ncbi:hypothetical protein CUMW_177800 [Citrus unshiu]|uniref:Uncharacterized protein n=1 Tax=Citrus unshiu TaxID=55188 RepID=A0A2H5PXX5_CITUN|nr:hypothetical protein CUMW_177800 [Citrus unshiu]
MLHRIETLQQRKIKCLGQLQTAVIHLVLAVQRRLTKLRGAPAKHIIMVPGLNGLQPGLAQIPVPVKIGGCILVVMFGDMILFDSFI